MCHVWNIYNIAKKNGQRFTDALKLLLIVDPNSCSQHKLNSNEAKIIKEAYLIMIDEVSMMHYYLLDMLDRFLKELMQSNEFMGGKLILLMHDFRQILPVVPGGNRGSIVTAAVPSSDVWKHFKSLLLTRNMRVERLLQENPSPERRQNCLPMRNGFSQ